MDLTLNRKKYTTKSTIGDLLVNGKKLCDVLEDVVRDKNKDGDLDDAGEEKVFGKTAIPSGKYEIIISFSNRFQKQMPLLLNVKGFEGIRMHSGNQAEDTEGCLILGSANAVDWVSNSKIAYDALMKELKKATKNEKIDITINDLH